MPILLNQFDKKIKLYIIIKYFYKILNTVKAYENNTVIKNNY